MAAKSYNLSTEPELKDLMPYMKEIANVAESLSGWLGLSTEFVNISAVNLNAENRAQTLLKQWLDGSEEPPTLEVLLKAIRDCRKGQLAKKIEEDLIGKRTLPPSASQSQNQHVTGNNQQHMVVTVSAPEPDQHQYSHLDTSVPHPNAKTQSSNTPYQPAPATATIPQDQSGPGVEFVNEQDAQLENVKFAIITANRNERESAKYFMGAQMINCDLSSHLQDPTNLKDRVAFRTDGISAEFVETEPLFESRKVAETNFRYTYTYFYVQVCGVLGVLTECYRMGSHFNGASRDTVNVLLETARDKKWGLQAVFLVGCCGCTSDPKENVSLGTVLIAKSIIPHAGKRTGTGLNTSRKNDYPINQDWVELLIDQNGKRNVSKKWKVQNLRDVEILSGDTLMADDKEAEKLRTNMIPKIPVLGFEMEGAGAYEAISRWNTNPKISNPKPPVILVVKGVSDFADSVKNETAPTAFFDTMTGNVDKNSRQQICTMMSLMVVFRAIKATDWG